MLYNKINILTFCAILSVFSIKNAAAYQFPENGLVILIKTGTVSENRVILCRNNRRTAKLSGYEAF